MSPPGRAPSGGGEELLHRKPNPDGPLSSRERARVSDQRRKGAGLVRLTVWVTAEDVDTVRRIQARALRRVGL